MTTTTSTIPAASAPLSRDETGRLFGQTMGLVALTAGVFALGAYLGRDMSGGAAILCFFAASAVLLAMNFAVQRRCSLPDSATRRGVTSRRSRESSFRPRSR